MAAIVLYVVLIVTAARFYSPALTEQIRALGRDGHDSPIYRAATQRGTVIGAGLFLPILGILFMMVVKPAF